MTHYDPRDWEPDEDPDGDSKPLIVWAIVLIAAAVIFCLVMAWPANASDRVYIDGFEQPDPCAGQPPAGYSLRYRTWQETWSAPNGRIQASFPNSIGSAVPIGADRNQITVVPFVASAGQYASIFFDPAQANNGIGYGQPRPALAMFVGISECPGDLRLTAFCSRYNNTGAVVWTAYASPGACEIQPGQTYYMSVTPHDPETGAYMCPDPNQSGCDVQAVHRGN